jgi:hypothetical protein
MRDIGAMPTRCAPKEKAFSLTSCVSLAGEGRVIFFTAFDVKLFVFIFTRRSGILRLEAMRSSRSERNLCVNFGQAQIRYSGFLERNIFEE